jgi:hypothetical protein
MADNPRGIPARTGRYRQGPVRLRHREKVAAIPRGNGNQIAIGHGSEPFALDSPSSVALAGHQDNRPHFGHHCPKRDPAVFGQHLPSAAASKRLTLTGPEVRAGAS